MCDAVEGATGNFSAPSADGVGLTKALDNYAKWWSSEYLPGSKCITSLCQRTCLTELQLAHHTASKSGRTP